MAPQIALKALTGKSISKSNTKALMLTMSVIYHVKVLSLDEDAQLWWVQLWDKGFTYP